MPIQTTHAGVLPRPDELLGVADATRGDALIEAAPLSDRRRTALADVVRRQAEIGVSIVNDGDIWRVETQHTATGEANS